MKYMRRTAGYSWTDYKTNAQIAKELKITPILDKLLEYKRIWIQHVNRMHHNRLPRIMKQYSPIGRRNHGRFLKRLLDTWDRNGSTSGPTPWQIYDDDDYYLLKIRWKWSWPTARHNRYSLGGNERNHTRLRKVGVLVETRNCSLPNKRQKWRRLSQLAAGSDCTTMSLVLYEE